MTNEEALKKVRKMWGRKAMAEYMGSYRTPAREAYAIHGHNDGNFGTGDSWEAAFADASSRAKGDGDRG